MAHCIRIRRPSTQRGMAFASAMLVLLGLMAVMLLGGAAMVGSGGGTAGVAAGSVQLTSARMRSTAAAELAESGVELTMQWLHAQSVPPAQTTAFAPALWSAAFSGSPQRAVLNYPDPSDSRATFSVLIYPDSGNPGTFQKKYLIECVGSSGGVQQVVRTYVQRVSFAKYAYFSDVSAPDALWTTGLSSFGGPVHCNNSDGVQTAIVWKGSGATLLPYSGTDALTVSAPAIRWYYRTPVTSLAPRSQTDWLSVAAGGQNTVHVGTPVIPFPVGDTTQKTGALGGQAAPATTGVFVPNTGGAAIGGVYVHGEVQSMTLAVDAAGNQTVLIQQTDLLGLPMTTLVTFVALLNQTVVVTTNLQGVLHLPVQLVQTYAGTTNGMIYCDGNIGQQTLPKSGGLSGIVSDNQLTNLGVLLRASRLTIATAPDKNMNINGSVMYNTTRILDQNGLPVSAALDALFGQKAGTLGLISRKIEIVDRDGLNAPLTNVEVDAAALAYDTFDACDPETRPSGRFFFMGSFLVQRGGAFGKLNAGAALSAGLTTSRAYDGRLATAPPPFFPVVTDQYEILSWQTASQTL